MQFDASDYIGTLMECDGCGRMHFCERNTQLHTAVDDQWVMELCLHCYFDRENTPQIIDQEELVMIHNRMQAIKAMHYDVRPAICGQEYALLSVRYDILVELALQDELAEQDQNEIDIDFVFDEEPF